MTLSTSARASLKALFRAAPLPIGIRRRVLYLARHRRLPRFRRPCTFSEKVNWRILYDRREVLAFTCDKLRVKEEARQLGMDTPDTLWSGTDLRDAADLPLPQHWVLKPNHRTALVHFGSGPMSQQEAARLASMTEGWLHDFLGRELGEWAYSAARQMLFIEEAVRDRDAHPLDYRVYTFGGRVGCIQVDDTFSSHTRRFYTPMWEPLDVRQRVALAEPIDAPAGLHTMIGWAKEFGKRFDFMRVDFYDVDGRVLLGELTPYPCGGLVPFEPTSFDAELGRGWSLPELP